MPTMTAVDDVIANVSRRDVLKAGAALTLAGMSVIAFQPR